MYEQKKQNKMHVGSRLNVASASTSVRSFD